MKYSKVKQFLKQKKIARIGAAILALLIVAGGIGGYHVYAGKSNVMLQENAAKSSEEDTETLLNHVLTTQAGGEDVDVEKEETVYVVAASDGTEKEVIVSDWLKNKEGLDVLQDTSDLSGIENVKGDEKYTQSASGKLTWQADGKDIYYQGQTSRELPVKVQLTYYLDGKKIAPEELSGKSGKVKIRMDYENKEKSGDVYVPFACLSGMVLNDNFTNIEVTNGKILGDGSKNMVIGVAFPGLADSLDIGKTDFDGELEIPDYLEVTADVRDFSLDMTMTLVMSDILQELDMDQEIDLSAVEDAVNNLESASELLKNGGKELRDGTEELKSGIHSYTDGVASLKRGINTYTKGVSKVKKGVGDYTDGVSHVAAGTQALEDKSGELAQGIQSLVMGASRVQGYFEGDYGLVKGSAAVSDGVKKLDQELKKGLTESDKNQADAAVNEMFSRDGQTYQGIKSEASSKYESVLKGSDELKNGVEAGVGEVMYQAYYAAFLQLKADSGLSKKELQEGAMQFAQTMTGYSESQISDASGQLIDAIASGSSEQVGESVADACKDAALIGVENGISTTKQAVASQIEAGGKQSLVSGADSLASGVEKLYQEGIQPLTEGMDTLNAGVPELTLGIRTLNQGASTLNQKSKELNQGVKTLDKKGLELNMGATSLDQNSEKLQNGAGQVKDGAIRLNDGIVQFDKEGIQKISEAYHGDVEKLTHRIDRVLDAGRSYHTFSGLSEDMTGSVKFIIRTEGL